MVQEELKNMTRPSSMLLKCTWRAGEGSCDIEAACPLWIDSRHHQRGLPHARSSKQEGTLRNKRLLGILWRHKLMGCSARRWAHLNLTNAIVEEHRIDTGCHATNDSACCKATLQLQSQFQDS